MIDFHCHILPGVDDGAQTIEDSIAMAHVAVSEGISTIVCTPHHKNGTYVNHKEDVLPLVLLLQEALDEQDIPLKVLPGQEVRINGEYIEDITDNRYLLAGEVDKYVLVEFPSATVPAYSGDIIFNLLVKGITPIIVHPERNHAIIKDPTILQDFVVQGALSQITASSYTGKFGKDIQRLCKQLIEANLTHFIASDAHNVTGRTFRMKDAYQKLDKDFGSELVEHFKDNAQKVIDSETIYPRLAMEVKKKKRFFFF